MYSIIGVVIHFVTDSTLIKESNILHHNQFACDVTLHAGYGIKCIVPPLIINGTIYLALGPECLVGEIVCLKKKSIAYEKYNI